MKKAIYTAFLAAALCMVGGCSNSTTTDTTDKTTTSESTAESTKKDSTTTTTDTAKNETDTTAKTDTTAEAAESTTTAKTDTTTNKTAAATASTSDFQNLSADLQNAFSNKGYKIYDVDKEYNEYSFNATGNMATLDIDLQYYPTLEQAQWEYTDETSVDWDEDFTVADTLDTTTGSMTILYNGFNSIYDIVGIREADQTVYTIENIPEGGLDQVTAVLEELGW